MLNTMLNFYLEIQGIEEINYYLFLYIDANRIRSSLLFDHTLSAEQSALNAREVLTTFQQLCEKSLPDIRADVPGLFTKLVHQMKSLDSRALNQIPNSIRTTCAKAE